MLSVQLLFEACANGLPLVYLRSTAQSLQPVACVEEATLPRRSPNDRPSGSARTCRTSQIVVAVVVRRLRTQRRRVARRSEIRRLVATIHTLPSLRRSRDIAQCSATSTRCRRRTGRRRRSGRARRSPRRSPHSPRICAYRAAGAVSNRRPDLRTIQSDDARRVLARAFILQSDRRRSARREREMANAQQMIGKPPLVTTFAGDGVDQTQRRVHRAEC